MWLDNYIGFDDVFNGNIVVIDFLMVLFEVIYILIVVFVCFVFEVS